MKVNYFFLVVTLNRQEIWGKPNQRKTWKKKLWKKLPRFIQSLVSTFNKMIIQRRILNGRKGILFQIFQGFWFRIITDMKLG